VTGRAVADGPAGTVVQVRRLLSPGWVTLHVVVVLGTVAMLWLGYWQWTGGFFGHSLKNTGYALQWWVFAVFAVYFWIKLMRDAVNRNGASSPSARAPLGGLRRPSAPPPVGIREYRMASAPVVADESDLGRYNAYLAALDAAPVVSAPTPATATTPASSVSDDLPAKENS
jgi:hypothetical protein